MADDSIHSAGGHLQYYRQHAISPVHYRVEHIDSHFDRRDSLYRSLGLPPVTFRNARVIEIAPGSGQNSLYVAACQPASYDLVEPNPTGLRDIEAAYRAFDRPHTAPRIHPVTFQDFETSERFDIMLCENWLGSLPNEVRLIGKLASLVAPGGTLVLTMVPPSGFFANIMRKLFALRLDDSKLSFEDRTDRLVDVFGPHLSTIANMTRSHRDWVHDCMLNPHYLDVALPLETILDTVGHELEALASLPRFTLDWRWFKALTGEGRDFNGHMLAAYRRNVHNFVDYRRIFAAAQDEDTALNTAFLRFHAAALVWKKAFLDGADTTAGAAAITATLSDIAAAMKLVDSDIAAAVEEAIAVWAEPQLRPEQVRDMTKFAALFGRETVYISFTRPRHGRADV
ncbi:MAG: methyltransferase domain-containing protein [Pseudolabrys sp.]|nr:methyltransferase domain-containing protein [Pseudolabrys sp.]MDP2295737.1 methyltransferase domain-containing protein [Pseudolabrys sp.]